MAIFSAKGGSSKTTTAINLAASLATKRSRWLLVDLDPQATATLAVGHAPAPGLLDVLRGRAPASSRIVPAPNIDGLDVLPGSPELVAAERELAGEPGAERLLALALRPTLRRYAGALIDCGPGVNLLAVSALAAAHLHVAPMPPTAYAAAALPDTLELAARVRERLNRQLRPSVILLCQVTRARLAQEAVASLRRRYGRQVLRAEVPRAQVVEVAAARRRDVVTLRPSSPVALAYRAAARELLRR